MSALPRVCDFLNEMYEYPDLSVSMEIQNAIKEAIHHKRIHEQDLLTQRTLMEIRNRVHELAKNVDDPMSFLLVAIISSNSNPTEDALQLLEERMRKAPK